MRKWGAALSLALACAAVVAADQQAPVDLLMGNTYGKYIARAENIPFVRFGFPILDRISHRVFPTVGYQGALRLIDKMIDALFDKKDRECPEEWMELVM